MFESHEVPTVITPHARAPRPPAGSPTAAAVGAINDPPQDDAAPDLPERREVDDPRPGAGVGNGLLQRAVEAVAAAVEQARGAGARGGLDAGVLRERLRLYERLGGLATAGLADAIRALADNGVLEGESASSTAEWVKANTNRSGRDAARVARLATELSDLPATREALASGRITRGRMSSRAPPAMVGSGPPATSMTRSPGWPSPRHPRTSEPTSGTANKAVDAAAMLRDEARAAHPQVRPPVAEGRRDMGACPDTCPTNSASHL